MTLPFSAKPLICYPTFSGTNVIAAGDHNVILDWHLDRSSKKASYPSNASTVLKNLISTTNLVDIRRIQHPTNREDSFFSKMHNSYSRIDYFLLDSKLIPNVMDTKYHNILISDHAPAAIILDFKGEMNPKTTHISSHEYS